MGNGTITLEGHQRVVGSKAAGYVGLEIRVRTVVTSPVFVCCRQVDRVDWVQTLRHGSPSVYLRQTSSLRFGDGDACACVTPIINVSRVAM